MAGEPGAEAAGGSLTCRRCWCASGRPWARARGLRKGGAVPGAGLGLLCKSVSPSCSRASQGPSYRRPPHRLGPWCQNIPAPVLCGPKACPHRGPRLGLCWGRGWACDAHRVLPDRPLCRLALAGHRVATAGNGLGPGRAQGQTPTGTDRWADNALTPPSVALSPWAQTRTGLQGHRGLPAEKIEAQKRRAPSHTAPGR